MSPNQLQAKLQSKSKKPIKIEKEVENEKKKLKPNSNNRKRKRKDILEEKILTKARKYLKQEKVEDEPTPTPTGEELKKVKKLKRQKVAGSIPTKLRNARGVLLGEDPKEMIIAEKKAASQSTLLNPGYLIDAEEKQMQVKILKKIQKEKEEVTSKKKKNRKKKKRKKSAVASVAEEEAKRSKSNEKSNQLASEALSYLQKWEKYREMWKFEKLKQVWLLKNSLNSSLIPDRLFEPLLRYISSIKGVSRDLTLSELENFLNSVEKTAAATAAKKSSAESSSSPNTDDKDTAKSVEDGDGDEKTSNFEMIRIDRAKQIVNILKSQQVGEDEDE